MSANDSSFAVAAAALHPLHDPAAHEVARAAGVASAIPTDLSRGVAGVQSALDPFMAWLLLALLVLAGGLLWRRWESARGQTMAGAGGRAQRPGQGMPLDPETTRSAPWLDGHVAAGCVLLLGAAFAWLAWTIHSGPYNAVLRLDAHTAAFAQAHDAPWLRWLAVHLSDLGDVLPLSLLTIAVALWLLRRRQRVLAAGWLLGVTINSVGVRVMKNVIERARPEHMADVVTSGFSFPSGHTAGSLMVFGLLTWVLCDQLGARWRPWLGVLGALLAGGIAASRIVLGVHYASDVVGGLLWGAMMLVTTIALIEHARRW